MSISALGEDFYLTITTNVPDPKICDIAFESFLEGVHPIIPICDTSALKQNYLEFQRGILSSSSVESLALILSILVTGAANSNKIEEEPSRRLLQLYERIFTTIDLASYQIKNTISSIQLLQAYMILNTFKASYLAPFMAYGFLPLAIRFAQSLRLHTEPREENTVESEVRRRIWWHLVFIDIESTIATGLPPILHRSSFTTQLPSLFDDLVKSSSMMPEAIPGQFSPMMIAIQGHFQWAQKMQVWFEKLPSQAEVTNFKAMIGSLVEMIPDSPSNEWPRTYLLMQIDRAYCMLGLRFWQLDQYKGTGCQSEVAR
jgi:hypothetical protein